MTRPRPPGRRRKQQARRRQGSDSLQKLLFFINATAWFILLLAVVLIGNAIPQQETLIDRFFEVETSNGGHRSMATTAFMLLFGNLVLASFGMLIHHIRSRRDTDPVQGTSLILLILSFLGILFYFFYF